MPKIRSLLINEEQLRMITPISGTFDWDYITPHVLTAQTRDLQTLIGGPLYQRLLNGISNDDLNADELTLLEDYAIYVVAWWTMAHAYPFLTSKLVQSTLTKVEIDEGDTVEQDESMRLSGLARQNGNFYNERLLQYMLSNNDKYPEYQTLVEGEIEPSQDKTYKFGINIDDDPSWEFTN